MNIFNLFRRKELLATLPARKVDNLSAQAFIKEMAQSENVRVEDLAVFAAYFQEFLGVNILDEAKMPRSRLVAVLTGSLSFHRRKLLVLGRKKESYQVFSTIKTENLVQELARLQQTN